MLLIVKYVTSIVTNFFYTKTNIIIFEVEALISFSSPTHPPSYIQRGFIIIIIIIGERCSCEVRVFARGAMGRRIGPSWYVLSCLWDGTYKITLAVNRKE